MIVPHNIKYDFFSLKTIEIEKNIGWEITGPTNS